MILYYIFGLFGKFNKALNICTCIQTCIPDTEIDAIQKYITPIQI